MLTSENITIKIPDSNIEKPVNAITEKSKIPYININAPITDTPQPKLDINFAIFLGIL